MKVLIYLIFILYMINHCSISYNVFCPMCMKSYVIDSEYIAPTYHGNFFHQVGNQQWTSCQLSNIPSQSRFIPVYVFKIWLKLIFPEVRVTCNISATFYNICDPLNI